MNSAPERRPERGDIVRVRLPHAAPGKKPVNALLLQICPETDQAPVYAVIPVHEHFPMKAAEDYGWQFFMRVQNRIFPLARTGSDTLDVTKITVLPVTGFYFPDLVNEPRWRDDVLMGIQGSIAPDWLDIIRSKRPHPHDWNWHAVPASFRHMDFVETFDQIDRQNEALQRKMNDSRRPQVSLGRYGIYRPTGDDPS